MEDLRGALGRPVRVETVGRLLIRCIGGSFTPVAGTAGSVGTAGKPGGRGWWWIRLRKRCLPRLMDQGRCRWWWRRRRKPGSGGGARPGRRRVIWYLLFQFQRESFLGGQDKGRQRLVRWHGRCWGNLAVTAAVVVVVATAATAVVQAVAAAMGSNGGGGGVSGFYSCGGAGGGGGGGGKGGGGGTGGGGAGGPSIGILKKGTGTIAGTWPEM